MISDAERQTHAEALTDLILHLVRQFSADRDLGTDNADIGLRAALRAALTITSERGLDIRTAAALVNCTLEGLVYGK